jgi:hypothetical protein
MFQDPRSLGALYPRLVRHAMHHFASPDVMRFLGRKVHPRFAGELTTSFKHRVEGVRVKHWVNGNSINMYDKAGCVLRVETTLANPTDFKVFRPRHDDPEGKLDWRPLRKGVADLHRRAEVSNRANANYLDALAVIDDGTTVARVLDAVGHPAFIGERRVRAIRTGDPHDIALLAAISRGEFAVRGSAIAICARFCTRPHATMLQLRRLVVAPLRSGVNCGCSGRTASSKRSAKRTATSSPMPAFASPPRSVRFAPPRSSNCSPTLRDMRASGEDSRR